MKKVILILTLVFTLVSCSGEDDSPNYYSVILPVIEVEVPQEFVINQTYEIKVWYERPSTCHAFSGFYYEKNLNERVVAVQNIVTEAGNCEDLVDEVVEASFNFQATVTGSYVFKFWKGTDENGTDIFEEVEVLVVN